MRRFSYIFYIGLLVAAFAMPAGAQDKTEAPKTAEPPKTEESAPKQDANKANDGIDLDKFFKKGEENAKNGASCDKPVKPADPIA